MQDGSTKVWIVNKETAGKDKLGASQSVSQSVRQAQVQKISKLHASSCIRKRERERGEKR